MKKLLSILTLGTLASTMATTNTSLVAYSNNHNIEFQFQFKNLLKSQNIVAQAQDNIGNIYFATFDNSSLLIPGIKIEKYDIKTTKIYTVWHNKDWKTGINKMIINQNNIYVGSINGGAYILNNNSSIKQIPEVSGSVTDMFINKNYLYINTVQSGLYQYNITSDITEKINLPDNYLPYTLFIDSDDNMYISAHNQDNNKVYIFSKDDKKPQLITGDDFFNKNGVNQFVEINQKIYFYSVEYNGNKSCLYDSDLNSNNVNYLLELTYNNVKVFNIKNKLGLIFKVNSKHINK